MTREELEKEAKEYVSKYQGWGWIPHEGSAVYGAMLDSYIDSAEPREKRIAELEAQIKKMKQERSAEVRQRAINEIVDKWEAKENE